MWDPQAATLGERFRLLRYDLPGHGNSPAPPGAYSLADLGRELLEVLDALGIEQALLCGLSIGGMISMWVAAHAPERVKALVVCCTSAHIDPTGSYRERAALVREQGIEPVVEGALARWVSPGFAQREPAVVARLRDALLRCAPAGYAGCCDALAEMDLREDLTSIAAPTLVIAGAQDPATPPEHGRLIAELVRGARFELVPDARHLANIEQPRAVGELISGFLPGGAG
jgi:3-oxoadipate enol-lactonase